ncbi:PREDICTED: uncharacterized protein LOC101295613 [Fragaria vesca subsp. vesca]|uniref:uncharacterized protein LOC101295613 n=1 Tax=Fragaria vesca subsp. vesca TaxID=101020 RepID=UPI0002C2E85E|nr:PREDICTED: uncharacterized protein LOC101295613 [Fragaria vesca subsp. vesca]
MIEDYFVERPVYSNIIFRQRYRMQKPVFNHIMVDLYNFDDFLMQKPDATGKLGLLLEYKMTSALQMLAYGTRADHCDEVTRMGASTSLKCHKKFCAQVEYLYGGWYLRAPNAVDLQRPLHKGQQRGFPGMIGSISCMHWKWKNCLKGWFGAFSSRKRYHTVILEVVASYDTHV